tara:strand:- start:558 stop:998 length:441 start_codon:yes stop_codon:yes gene_type:complete
MFSQYDYTYFPVVTVKFNGGIQNESEFYYFTEEWKKLYINGQNFIFIFDTTNMAMMNIKYCIMMAKFIKELKYQPYHYLQKSIIIIKNNFVKTLLDIIFFIQKPVANVYLTKDPYESIFPIMNLLFYNNPENYINVCNTIKPNTVD